MMTNAHDVHKVNLTLALGPIHMVVGTPWKWGTPIHPRSEKPGVHMQTRGAGVKFKMLSRGR